MISYKAQRNCKKLDLFDIEKKSEEKEEIPERKEEKE